MKDKGRQTADDGRWTTDGGRQAWMALGCAAALLAFLIHGALDMFLEYSATNLLLWALLGALGSLAFRDAQPSYCSGRTTKDERRTAEST